MKYGLHIDGKSCQSFSSFDWTGMCLFSPSSHGLPRITVMFRMFLLFVKLD